jgi:hypothetical protein
MNEAEQHSNPAQAPFFLVMCRLFALFFMFRGIQIFSLEHFNGFEWILLSLVTGGVFQMVIGILLWFLAPELTAWVFKLEIEKVRMQSLTPWDSVAYGLYCLHIWMAWAPDWAYFFFHSMNTEQSGQNWHESDGLKILVTSLLAAYFLLNRKLRLLIGFISQLRGMEKSK